MGEVIKVLDWLLENLVQICTVVLELFGIIVLVSTAVSCFVQWIRNKRQLIRWLDRCIKHFNETDPKYGYHPESGTGNCAGVGI